MPSLNSHPDHPRSPALAIEAQATRGPGGVLHLTYVLSGAAGSVALPPPSAPGRADELWRHTCFEAFVRAEGADGYHEFNLSPSTQWAAYAFDGYRSSMRPADVAAPQIEVRRGTDRFELLARFDLNGSGLDDLDWRIGLSAVVKAADKSASYWALAHPAGKPDFHHADCFTLELPAIGRS